MRQLTTSSSLHYFSSFTFIVVSMRHLRFLLTLGKLDKFEEMCKECFEDVRRMFECFYLNNCYPSHGRLNPHFLNIVEIYESAPLMFTRVFLLLSRKSEIWIFRIWAALPWRR